MQRIDIRVVQTYFCAWSFLANFDGPMSHFSYLADVWDLISLCVSLVIMASSETLYGAVSLRFMDQY